MLSRVTNQTMMASAQRNLQSNRGQLALRQEQASSLRALTRPSDNPTAAAAALDVRAQQSAAGQYDRNISNGTAWLATVDTAMTASVNILSQVRDLTVQGGNGSLNQDAKDALAIQVESLKADLLSQANTTYQGRTVFAGNSDAGAAFTGTPLAFTGTAGASVERRVAPNVTVQVDADGAAVFGTGADSVFGLLDNIAGELRAGGDPTARLNELDKRLGAVSAQHADVGARQAGILKAKDTNVELKGSLEAQRSGLEDLDLGQAVLDLKLQEVNYQAALAVTARVLPSTLMDFLR
jgi:flagellar hook-associated protein 3 FlgL